MPTVNATITYASGNTKTTTFPVIIRNNAVTIMVNNKYMPVDKANTIIYSSSANFNALIPRGTVCDFNNITPGTEAAYSKVSNIAYAFINSNVTGTIPNFPAAMDMTGAYKHTGAIADPKCGKYVTDMTQAYEDSRVTGRFNVGNNVRILDYAYNNCIYLTGDYKCPDKVESAVSAYAYSTSTSAPVFGNNIANADYMYYRSACTGDVNIGPEVTDMNNTFAFTSVGNVDMGIGPSINAAYAFYSSTVKNINLRDSLTDVSHMFEDSTVQEVRFGSQMIENIAYMFNNCRDLVTVPTLWANVTNAQNAFRNCPSLVGPPSVTTDLANADHMYTDSNVNGDAVWPAATSDITEMYRNCMSLESVEDIPGYPTTDHLFDGCVSLTGEAALNNDTTSAKYMYNFCTALETANMGLNLIEAESMYAYCRELTGHVETGEALVNMQNTFYGCWELHNANIGNAVENMSYTFYDCKNLQGDIYLGSNVNNLYSCFYSTGTEDLNIYFSSESVGNIARLLDQKAFNERNVNIYLSNYTEESTSSSPSNTLFFNGGKTWLGEDWTKASTNNYFFRNNVRVYHAKYVKADVLYMTFNIKSIEGFSDMVNTYQAMKVVFK